MWKMSYHFSRSSCRKLKTKIMKRYRDPIKNFNVYRVNLLQAPEYRQLLIQSIHICAVKFSEVAASVVHALMEFLGDSNNPSALDVVAFVRWVSFIHSYTPSNKLGILARWLRNSQLYGTPLPIISFARSQK